MFSFILRNTFTKPTPLINQFFIEFRQNVKYLSSEQQSQQRIPLALRSKKSKTKSNQTKQFLDLKRIRTLGGKGGDGCVSFLSLWCNENAGPDGADGGSGGHVVFQATYEVNNLSHISSIIKAENGERGYNKDRHGKNAIHEMVKVPVGTIVKNYLGSVVGDMSEEGMMFVAARGGAGGKGNHFFTTELEQAPKICEYGAAGEDLSYVVELRSMAHIGLIGLPNAGKSTLLRAITRAKPKVAPYAFTTLRPNLGIVEYDDYVQVSIADLPGLIAGSHQNKGLGIQFLKHAERCGALLFIIDVSDEKPWRHYEMLKYEMEQFSAELANRPQMIIANKIDNQPIANENIEKLKEKFPDLAIVPISAKIGTNLTQLLEQIRKLYDKFYSENDRNKEF